MADLPFHVSDGLFLEQSGILLPWFKRLHEITKKGGKPLPEKGRTTQLFWASESVFGGLQVSVQALPYGSGLFHLTQTSKTDFTSAQHEFSVLLTQLSNRFGEPHESDDSEQQYPISRWRWGDICLSLLVAERFLDYAALSLSKGVIR